MRRIPSSWCLFRQFILIDLNLIEALKLSLDVLDLNRLAAGLHLFLALLSFLRLRFQEKTSNHGGLSLPEQRPSWTLEDHPCSF